MEGNTSNPSTSSTSNELHLILSNIEQYKAQLEEVNVAIETANGEDKVKLQELQLNLISILELMLGQLDQVQPSYSCKQTGERTETLENSKCDSNKDIEDEFKKFKMEIAELEGNGANFDEPEEFETHNENKDVELNLRDLEGQDVGVPFMERWGGYSYHNAVVLNLVAEDGQINFEKPQVLALFSQPTSLSMVPCKFFLDGKCKFDSEKCKFSHGETVDVGDLKEYNEPDREQIVSGSSVLALHEGQDIWHRGKVEDVLEGRAGFSFNCSPCGKVFEVPLESMFPLFADEDNTDEIEVFKTNVEKSVPEDEDQLDSISEGSASNKLGEWEKHTKGIGSKLMAKMGYVAGTGLGPRGEGRVDPVQVHVYPQGISLDYCMRLKEASNGEGPLEEVEKKLILQEKREQDKKNRQRKYLEKNASVFDIINNKLSSKSCSSVKGHSKHSIDTSNDSLKSNSIKELNRKNFQLSSNIDKLKGELSSLNQSRERQSKDSTTMKAIDKKMRGKAGELSILEEAFKRVEAEQLNRKNLQKFCSF